MTDLDRIREAIKRVSRNYGAGYLKPGAGITTVLDAARRYVLLAETSQRVEWCEVHELPIWGASPDSHRTVCQFDGKHGEPDEPCSFVSKWLTDPGELVDLFEEAAERDSQPDEPT